MELLTGLLLSVAIAGLLALIISRNTRNDRMPPGPPGIPILGNLLSIPERDYLKFEEFRQDYGEIMTIQLGGATAVFLNSSRAAREALVGQADCFSHRHKSEYMSTLFLNGGIIFTDGPVWQAHRRFSLRLMRDFGMGKDVTEKYAVYEAEVILERVKEGEPVDMAHVFTDAVNNVVGQLAFSERTGTEDPNFAEFQNMMNSVNGDRSFLVMLPAVFPHLMKIPFFLNVFEYFVGFNKVMRTCNKYIYRKISEHEKALKATGIPLEDQEGRDLCDALLIEQARQKKENEKAAFTDQEVMRDLEDLFLASTESTSMSLTWAIFMMSWHPDIQKKVHDEIDKVIGRERKPDMKDRIKLPYLTAVLEESMRFATIAPCGMPHASGKDTDLLGYFIPKGTMILINMWSIHRDPALWKRPYQFYPEHFLNSDGQFQPSENLMSFSMGRRVCLGEGVARMELFIFFTILMQRWSVRLADPDLDVEKVMMAKGGGTRRLLPHKVIFSAR